ncbi:DASH complex subunit Duo1 [Schizosaccharomyces octosporus yFS286]|uniref:DASH complex subunit DUO1 n=1 Tax=Schizosaccharomyces octosporus (strain yFS286) TaxID=483514 RepID=S9R8N9_SCHOY|nr:DASH complex subunit Duo1 [Schizosaccharomyces octosporus yFS286]EPX70454.1 DASH complex subunit Duo1 [Schizosaccharomyces octosporus yFS286]
MSGDLRQELQLLKTFNEVIEKLTGSLRVSSEKLHSFEKSIQSANQLVNVWSSVQSQTDHTQQLLLNTDWKGPMQDLEEIETLQKQKIQQDQELEKQQQIQLHRQRQAEEQARREKEEALLAQKKRSSVFRGRNSRLSSVPSRNASSIPPPRPSSSITSSTTRPSALNAPANRRISSYSSVPRPRASVANRSASSSYPAPTSTVTSNDPRAQPRAPGSSRRSLYPKSSSRLRPPERTSSMSMAGTRRTSALPRRPNSIVRSSTHPTGTQRNHPG